MSFDFDFQKIFDPDATEFRIGNAYCLAQASILAYSNEDDIKSFMGKWGFDSFKFFNDPHDKETDKGTDTQAFVMANDDMILLAFRGTSSLHDAVIDANIKHVEGPIGQEGTIGMVHLGFNTALKSVWDEITGFIGDLRHTNVTDQADMVGNEGGKQGNEKPKSLWITGHSLGAALATLATGEMVLSLERPVRGLYTFGSPRVGNAIYAKAFDKDFQSRAFRFVNNNDLVTRVAPRALNYSHVGQLMYITVEGEIDSSSTWWERFLDRVQGRLEDFQEIFKGDLVTDGLEDHEMKHYLGSIKANLPKNLKQFA